MIVENASDGRSLRTEELEFDFVIVGGGLAGTCAAIAAARQGLRIALVQDRPVLGGNASSEVRLWVLGATSHMGNNNRWAREGGVVNEILEDNLHRNREGNPVIFDTVLLEKCAAEEKLTLLLNTAAFEVENSDAETIAAVHAFCPQNSTRYRLRAPLFCDASGDGILGFLSGAAFRMGAESRDEFGEGFAPAAAYGELLGHSMYFMSKDVGAPVKFTPPRWALKDIRRIPRYRQIRTNLQGCHFWWFEYGGRLDTVHQTEEIKWELWKVIYGVWDYIKNSGEFPEAETMTLEWVSHIPGKRESRRFEGDYLIRQQDVVERPVFEDVVAHGGWAMDLHPADGIYSPDSPCTQWHSQGVYGIPYRCYYSRNIRNLFLAGRIVSATHVAFGSTRVMATCGAGGAPVGIAAAICREHSCLPRDVSSGKKLAELQTRLDRMGQFLPGWNDADTEDLARRARVTASSTLKLSELKPGDSWVRLDVARAMLVPLAPGPCPRFSFEIDAEGRGDLRAELLRASRAGNFTPGQCLETVEIPLTEGGSEVEIGFRSEIEREGYHFVKLCPAPGVRVRTSGERMTGILSLSAGYDEAVAKSSVQQPPKGIGIDSFEFWLPQRRPEGRNLAMKIDPPLDGFDARNVLSGPARPVQGVNAWVADPADPRPSLTLAWPEPVEIGRVILEFDPDWDHPMESVMIAHPEEVAPFMVRDFDLLDASGICLAEVRDHHSARFDLRLPEPIRGTGLELRIRATWGASAAVFRFRVFGSGNDAAGDCGC